MDEKKGKLLLKLNSIDEVADPTTLRATFIIHDFERSANNQVITREVAEDNMHFLVNKPIVCKYIKADENYGLDALRGHEPFYDVDRDTSETFINTDTVSIGFFDNVYIDEVETDEGLKEMLVGEAIIWQEKYRNICSLLQEWIDGGITVPASVEFLYKNYSIIDGVEYVQSPVYYTAHAILNAEDRNNEKQVTPAFDDAKLVSMCKSWNSAVNKDIKRKEDYMEKVVEISKGSIKSLIFAELENKMSAKEYNAMWISDYELYDTYFVYEIYDEEMDKYRYFKVEYTKENGSVEVDLEAKVEVERVVKWEEMEEELDNLKEIVEENEDTITSLNAKVSDLSKDKKELSKSLNTATDSIAEMSKDLKEKEARLNELSEVEKQFNSAKFERILAERTAEFKHKFKSLNAEKVFNSSEVQELLKESVEDEGALISLNAKLVELIPKKVESKVEDVKSLNSKDVGNLINVNKSFDERYK